jgi:tight adherence protein C
MMNLLPTGVSLDLVLSLAAAATAVFALAAVWLAFVARDPLASRMRALGERRTALRQANRRVIRNATRTELRQSGMSAMRQVVARFNLMKGKQLEKSFGKLTRAGYRSKDAVIVYLFAKVVLPFAALTGVLVIFGLSQEPYSPMTKVIIILFAAVIGLYGADLFVKNVGDKRVKQMRKGMPDALDLLVICAEAGLSLDAALTRVGRELASASPPLADEFALSALELGFLPDRQQVLQNLMKRTDMQEMRALVNALQQSERYGTSLANSLRVLAAEYRDERMMRAEEKAARLPATMTVPMILFILPALFIVLGGPAALRIIDTFAHM